MLTYCLSIFDAATDIKKPSLGSTLPELPTRHSYLAGGSPLLSITVQKSTFLIQFQNKFSRERLFTDQRAEDTAVPHAVYLSDFAQPLAQQLTLLDLVL